MGQRNSQLVVTTCACFPSAVPQAYAACASLSHGVLHPALNVCNARRLPHGDVLLFGTDIWWQHGVHGRPGLPDGVRLHADGALRQHVLQQRGLHQRQLLRGRRIAVHRLHRHAIHHAGDLHGRGQDLDCAHVRYGEDRLRVPVVVLVCGIKRHRHRQQLLRRGLAVSLVATTATATTTIATISTICATISASSAIVATAALAATFFPPATFFPTARHERRHHRWCLCRGRDSLDHHHTRHLALHSCERQVTPLTNESTRQSPNSAWSYC